MVVIIFVCSRRRPQHTVFFCVTSTSKYQISKPQKPKCVMSSNSLIYLSLSVPLCLFFSLYLCFTYCFSPIIRPSIYPSTLARADRRQALVVNDGRQDSRERQITTARADQVVRLLSHRSKIRTGTHGQSVHQPNNKEDSIVVTTLPDVRACTTSSRATFFVTIFRILRGGFNRRLRHTTLLFCTEKRDAAEMPASPRPSCLRCVIFLWEQIIFNSDTWGDCRCTAVPTRDEPEIGKDSAFKE